MRAPEKAQNCGALQTVAPSRRPDPILLAFSSMAMGVAARVGLSRLRAVQRLIGTLVAFGLLLQALFTVPLAIRMTADAALWLQFHSILCVTASDRGTAADGHSPHQQLPAHDHGRCLVCQGHALPVGIRVLAPGIFGGLFDRLLTRFAAATVSLWQSDLYRAYHSRAPPVAV